MVSDSTTYLLNVLTLNLNGNIITHNDLVYLFVFTLKLKRPYNTLMTLFDIRIMGNFGGGKKVKRAWTLSVGNNVNV